MRQLFIGFLFVAFVNAKCATAFCPTCFAPPTSPVRSHDTGLFAKKKAPQASAKKIQVKMLKHVAGTGQAGQVVMVTPAFFNNKLRPSKSAEVISDEQAAAEEAANKAEAKKQLEQAIALKEKISETTLRISRKAGPDGHLFGGIGAKVVMQELKNQVAEEYLNSKSVKVAAITDEEGKKMRGDIKHTGTFGATIALSTDISAKLAIIVEEES